MKFLKDNQEWLFPVVFTLALAVLMAIAAHFLN